ncbi:MAG: hypothetical protein IPH82_28805 [Chloroflexi bacterium]|nr:hypothetical protein [Chloroflexota bacterium]
MDTITLIDEYVAVTPGEPYRLLPFGRIVKNGKVREITRELAARFRLPHFKPPIKLGSHKEETPAGGHIIGLEVRADGLYAIPEYTDGGMATLTTGGFRYHSPEIVWDGGFENPQTGELIAGPLIVGDALLHTPHLGEATALYSIEPIPGGTHMSENTVTVPAGALGQVYGLHVSRQCPADQPEPAPTPAQPEPQEDYAAKVTELTARLQVIEAEKAQLEADRARQSRVDAYAAELKATTLHEDAELFGVLAELPEDAAKAITQRIKALSEQAKAAKLTTDIGGNSEHTTPIDKFNAAIEAKMKDGLSRNDALMAIAKEQPEIIAAVRGGK